MSLQAVKWDREKVFDIIREFWYVEEWEDRGTDNELSIPATSEHPAINYDPVNNILYIEFPDEDEELPNPDNPHHYPDLEWEIKSLEDVDKLKEYLGEKTVEEIKQKCGKDLDCIITIAYNEIKKILEEQLRKNIKNLEASSPVYKVFCGVPVIVKRDVYETERFTDTGSIYIAYMPSKYYRIDLNQVESTEKLKCIINEILEDF